MPPAVAVVTALKGAVAAAGIMKSMAVAGTALSLVGTATKNPKLAKIGAVIGTVGTLGTMGAFGAGAKTLGMDAAGKAAAAAKTTAATTTAATTGGAKLARSALPAQPGAVGPLSTGYGSKGLLSSNIAEKATTNVLGEAGKASLFEKAGAAAQAGVKAIKDNPELAQIVAAGGVELANYLSGKTDAEIRDLEASIDVKDANAQTTLYELEREKKRRQNLNQGYLTVNPVITLPGQQPTGLLAQNMQRAPA